MRRLLIALLACVGVAPFVADADTFEPVCVQVEGGQGWYWVADQFAPGLRGPERDAFVEDLIARNGFSPLTAGIDVCTDPADIPEVPPSTTTTVPATTTSSTTTTTLAPATTTTSASTTTTVRPTTTTAAPTTVPTPTTTTPPSGKPGPNNTGPTSDPAGFTRLTAAQVEARMTPGAVIQNVYITGGDIDLLANNVTIRNFVLDAAGGRYGFAIRSTSTGLTLENGEIFGSTSSGILGTGFTARRLEIHHIGNDAFKAQPAGGPGGPVLVEASWWHHLGVADAAHGDGNQTQVGSPHPIVFRGNNCDMPRPLAGTVHTSCLMTSESASSSILFENNWLNGGAFTIYCEPQSNNITIRNNRFGRQYLYGVRGSFPCRVWTGNVWDDTNTPVNQ